MSFPLKCKKCTKCLENKPLFEFYKVKRYKDGLDYWCKSCKLENNNDSRRERYKNNPDKYTDPNKSWRDKNKRKVSSGKLKYMYDIDIEKYERMYKLQEGKCLICGEHKRSFGSNHGGEVKRDILVDHCHASYKVRGLLCHLCNAGLGYFKDNPHSLYKAMLQGFISTALGFYAIGYWNGWDKGMKNFHKEVSQ